MLTGGQVISEEVGVKLENATVEMLGTAKRVVITNENTTIVGGAGKQGGHRGPVHSDSPADRGDDLRLRPREAAGAAGEAVRRRGRDPRRRAFRGRDEIAQGSAGRRDQRHQGGGRRGHRARRRPGIDPLHRCGRRGRGEVRGRRTHGRAGLKRALEAPTRQIAENSAVDGGVVVARMVERTGELRLRCRAQGVCRSGRGRDHRSDQGGPGRLENAVSVASVLLLTEATMTEIPEAKKERSLEPEMAM